MASDFQLPDQPAADQHASEQPAPEPTLAELFEHYAALRDTIQGLAAERDALGEVLKEALARGERLEGEVYRGTLRRSRRVEYPLERFREVFGDAAALEAATIDRKKAEALAGAGDLNLDDLRGIAEVREVVSLVLTPLDRNR